MSYREGEALNWHFDRSEFTVTLLIQTPEEGGDFQYRSAEPPSMFAVAMRDSRGHWMESNEADEPSVKFRGSPPSGEINMTSPESLPRSLQFEVR